MLYIMWREKTSRIKKTATDIVLAWLCVSLEASGLVLIYMFARTMPLLGNPAVNKLIVVLILVGFGVAVFAVWMVRLIIEMSNGERETGARTVMEALGYKTSRLLLYCRLSSMFSMFAAFIPSVVTAWLICGLFSRQKIMIFGQELPVQMLQGALWWCFMIPLILLVLEMLLQQILMIRRNNIYYGREIAERLQG